MNASAPKGKLVAAMPNARAAEVFGLTMAGMGMAAGPELLLLVGVGARERTQTSAHRSALVR